MERLPFWGQAAVMGALALAIVAACYWFSFADMKQEITALQADLEIKNEKIQEGLAIERKLPEFEREVANLQRKLGDIQQILPTGTETGDLLRWIKNMTDQSNLDLKVFNPGQLQPREFYRDFPIEMDVIGRYHDLGIFLDRVSKYSRIINVDNLRMNQNSGGGDKTIRATFTATTFVYDESGAPTEVEQ
jgi:type IV pilus assembly protein PilO